jgi:hypothetical protein
MRSIEITETTFIFWEMRGNPVENHTDAPLMEVVHEIHEVGGGPEAACRSEVACGLVSPGTIEGMLHYGKKLDMGEAYVVDIICQERSDFPVTEPSVILLRHAPPGP